MGDYDQYQNSVLKIVTAGVNLPSNEFPYNNPSLRFKELEYFYEKESLNDYEIQEYLDSLDSYFRRNSNPWFDHFEPVLNGLNASYYGVMESTVLHTEMLSPLSTDVTWSKFLNDYPDNVIDEIVTNDYMLWLELMNILQPDIILTSLGAKYRKNIFNIQNLNWRRIENITTNTKGGERKRPYEVYCAIGVLGCGKKMPAGLWRPERLALHGIRRAENQSRFQDFPPDERHHSERKKSKPYPNPPQINPD